MFTLTLLALGALLTPVLALRPAEAKAVRAKPIK
jgi:hypothetical protein